MRLRCECGALVEAANVNVAAAVATCTACGSVFSIDQRAATTRAEPAVIPAAFATPISDVRAGTGSYRKPVSGRGGRWTYRWFRWYFVLLVAFLVFWNTISFSFVVGALSTRSAFGFVGLLMPHPWVGLVLSYWTLAHLFNRTTIELGTAGLSVVSGPIPWRSVVRSASDVAGFDVQRGWGNRAQGQFQVRVVGPDKRAKKLLTGLTEEEANYLAAELRAAHERDAGPQR